MPEAMRRIVTQLGLALLLVACGGSNGDAGGAGAAAGVGGTSSGGSGGAGTGGAATGGVGASGGTTAKPSYGGASALFEQLAPPARLVLHGDDLYWVESGPNGGTGHVVTSKKSGGASTSIYAGHPWGLTVDDTHVYWGDAQANTLYRSGLAGEAPAVIVTGLSSQVGDLGIWQAKLWWTENATPIGELRNAGLDGSTPVTAFSVSDILGALYATNDLLWFGSVNSLYALGTNDAQPNTVAPISSPARFAADAASAYVPQPDSKSIIKVSIAGGAPVTLVQGVDATSTFVYAGWVYYTDAIADGAGSVDMISVDGGTPTQIATGLTNPLSVQVDDTGVYWSNAGSYNQTAGSIMSAPRL